MPSPTSSSAWDGRRGTQADSGAGPPSGSLPPPSTRGGQAPCQPLPAPRPLGLAGRPHPVPGSLVPLVDLGPVRSPPGPLGLCHRRPWPPELCALGLPAGALHRGHPVPRLAGARGDARPSPVLGSTVDTERPARGGLVQCRWDDRGRGQRQVNVAASGSRPRLKPQRQSEGTQPGRPDRELGQDTWAAGLQRGSAGESGARGHSAGGRKESPHFPMLGPSGAGAFALGQGPHSRVAQRLARGQEGGGRQRGGRRPLFTVGPKILSCALGTIDGSGRQGMHFALTWRGSAAPQ